MASSFIRSVQSLDLEERILNLGLLGAIIGIFLPWFSGEWLGDETRVFNGLGFYTSVLGIVILLLHLFCLALTASPLVGGPHILKRKHREAVRFAAAILACVLALSALSVLTNLTFDFSRMEVRFGMYITLVASIVVALESGLRFKEQRRHEGVEEAFHHPDDVTARRGADEPPSIPPPPPPPPPPPMAPEDHRVRM